MTRDYYPPPPDLRPGAVVWVYARDSGGEAQEQSVAQQKAEFARYCQQYALVVAHVFEDEAKSGTSDKGRTGLQTIIDLTADPDLRPRAVLLWNFARLARNTVLSNYCKYTLRFRGIIVHSITDAIPEGDHAPIVEALIDFANQEKSRQTGRDVKRALQVLVRQGFDSGGFPPRGYKAEAVVLGHKRNGTARVVHKRVPDPELWELAKLAWQMRAQGQSYQEIQQATEGKLYKTKNCWSTFFRNKTYLGIGVCGELEFPDHHPALIDQATWDAVQAKQDARRALLTRRARSPGLLSGLAFCKLCGAPMDYQRDGHKWPYYICSRKLRENRRACAGRSVSATKANAKILEQVLTRVLTVDFARDLLNELRTEFSDTSAIDHEHDRISAQLAQCDRAIKNLLDLAEAFGAPAAIQRLQEREADKARLQSELHLLEERRRVAQVEINPAALDLVLAAWRGNLTQAQSAGDPRALRRLLKGFVDRIELDYDQVVLHYTYPLDGFTVKQDTPLWGHLVF